jgi:hypothetical protein
MAYHDIVWAFFTSIGAILASIVALLPVDSPNITLPSAFLIFFTCVALAFYFDVKFREEESSK